MELKFSRRVFLKSAAAAALAVSAAGLTTGCTGGEAERTYEVTLGEFKVRMAAASIERREKVGTDDVYLDIVPEVSVTYAGKGFAGASFKNVFAMKLGDTDLTLNTSGTVAGADFPIVNSAHVYKPSFSTKKREQYDAYDKGEAIRFSVTLSGQTGVFSIGKDGKVTAVEKK